MKMNGLACPPHVIGGILRSNWLHFAGFVLVSYVGSVLHWLVEEGKSVSELSEVLLYGLLYSIMFTPLYGWMPLIGFYLSIMVLDAVLFAAVGRKHTARILSVEWLLLSCLPMVWAFAYGYRIWFLLVASFAITQTMRYFRIRRMEDQFKRKYAKSKKGEVFVLPPS